MIDFSHRQAGRDKDPHSLRNHDLSSNELAVGYTTWNAGLVVRFPNGRPRSFKQFTKRFVIVKVGILSERYLGLSELEGVEVDVAAVHEHLNLERSMIFLGKCFIPYKLLTAEEKQSLRSIEDSSGGVQSHL